VSHPNDRGAEDEAAWLQSCDVENLTCRFPRQKSGDSQSVLSLVTLFGLAKKITRLPAGTGELKVADFSQPQNTGGSRPASRHTFFQANKSKQKWLPLRGAFCHAEKEKAKTP